MTISTNQSLIYPTHSWYYLLDRTDCRRGDGLAGRVISRHRSREAAERAEYAHLKAVCKANGAGSYVPTIIARGHHLGIHRISKMALYL